MDAAFSLDPVELAQLVRECRTAYKVLGEISYAVRKQEKQSRMFLRSLYIVKDIKAGDEFTEKLTQYTTRAWLAAQIL